MYPISYLSLSVWQVVLIPVLFLLPFVITYLLLPRQIQWMHQKGWTGRDVHKTARPVVAESGGISLVVGFLAGLGVIAALVPVLMNETLVLGATVTVAAGIGFFDDRKRLSSLKKIILCIGAGLPIFVANYLGWVDVDSPLLPIVGYTRLTIVYPLVLPLIIAVTTNTTNMLEGYNGEGAGTCFVVGCTLVVGGLIVGSTEAILYSLVMCGALLAFYRFNRFPARVFPGDVGTLAMGAMIGGIGIFGSVEVVMFCALLQHVFNSFYVVTSMHGFREGRLARVKDIYVDEHDVIHPSLDEHAPVTLPRLILAGGPLTEPQLVRRFLALTVISGIFGLVAAVVMQLTAGVVNIPLLVAVFGGGIALYAALFVRYRRIRGVSVIMILLLLGGLAFLVFVDQIIVEGIHSWFNVIASGVGAVLGLGLWYYVQARYFWYEIRKLDAREKRATGKARREQQAAP